MSRNRKRVNREIFARLISYAAESGRPVSYVDKARWISKLNDEDSNLFADAKCELLRLSRSKTVLKIVFDQRVYFSIAGLTVVDPPAYLAPKEVTPASLSLSIAEMGLKIVADPLAVFDKLEAPVLAGEMGAAYDAADVRTLFQSIEVFEYLDANENDKDLLYRLAGVCFIRSYGEGPLDLSEKTLQKIEDLFENSQGTFPLKILLQGLMSFSWDGFFLELYRCLENLYPIHRLRSLLPLIPSAESLHQLSEILEDNLSWRPREDESLQRTLAPLPPDLLRRAQSCFQCTGISKEDNASTQVAKSIYKLRNSIVHYRESQKVDRSKDLVWDDVIAVMTDMVSFLYTEHHAVLSSRPSASTTI